MRRQDKLLVIENVEIYNYYKERLRNFLSRESELSMNLLNCADNFPILKL